jgi:hypothetical protein
LAGGNCNFIHHMRLISRVVKFSHFTLIQNLNNRKIKSDRRCFNKICTEFHGELNGINIELKFGVIIELYVFLLVVGDKKAVTTKDHCLNSTRMLSQTRISNQKSQIESSRRLFGDV